MSEIPTIDRDDLETWHKVDAYRKPEPPSPETLELQRLRDLAERALRALNEDDFPQLRQDLRDALGTT